MPIDRESTLRQAEKLHREGKLDLAIAEYVRLVEEQPRDWSSLNALGDLYLRAGNVDRAVAQFVQIADHLLGEGFFPKAAAVYKKALKAKPDHEHAILRLAEIAATQELLADARAYLRRLWELRSERGDERGAADCLLRLASLPEADVETRLTGARAALVLGDTQRAIDLFRSAAEQLEQAGRGAAALEVLAQVAALDASDLGLRRELATKYLAAGQLEEAGQLLDVETVGSDLELLLALASLELARKDDAAARATLTRFVGLAPDRSSDVLRLAGELGRAGEPDRAFACAAVVVDDAVLRADWDRAIDVLQSFLVHGQHVPALVKLVHVSEDAGVEEVLQEAQERLVDAYLEQGQAPEAQAIAEALLARAPGSPLHVQRLRRAFELSGADPDEAIQRVLGRLDVMAPATEPVLAIEDSLLVEDAPLVVEHELLVVEDDPLVVEHELLVVEDDPLVVEHELLVVEDDPLVVGAPDSEPETEEIPAPTPAEETRHAQPAADPIEIDLSDIMAGLRAPLTPGQMPTPTQDEVADLSDLDAFLNSMRPRGGDYESLTEAASAYERGVQRLERGDVKEGLEELEEAARIPALRFPAAARLGREYVKRGQAHAGIEWLERAAEMPAPSRDAALAVLYDLGLALEGIGEGVRALAVMMEISVDDPGYRDVPQRIEALARQEDERRG